MGKTLILTDHSLHGFSGIVNIILNKHIKMVMSSLDACICVSHTAKENLALIAAIDPNIIYVIPNAVDTHKFKPKPIK